jgi:CYTH domain-containing protein
VTAGTNLTDTTEIELKFLVAEATHVALDEEAADYVEQGYLVIGADGSEARVRRRAGTTTLTVKAGRGLIRREHEVELDAGQFAALWPATEGRRIVKMRYKVDLKDAVAELDVYGGRHSGLQTVEVEFRNTADAEAFSPPAWFGRNVTNDDRYRNRSLAIHGLPAECRGLSGLADLTP